jgi:hypothetical protein
VGLPAVNTDNPQHAKSAHDYLFYKSRLPQGYFNQLTVYYVAFFKALNVQQHAEILSRIPGNSDIL